MPWVGFKPTVPVSKRAKTVHALDRWATMTGVTHIYLSIFVTSVCLYACQPLLSVSLYIKYVLYLSVYLSNTEFSFSTPISFCYISINLSSFSSRLPVSICPPTYYLQSLYIPVYLVSTHCHSTYPDTNLPCIYLACIFISMCIITHNVMTFENLDVSPFVCYINYLYFFPYFFFYMFL